MYCFFVYISCLVFVAWVFCSFVAVVHSGSKVGLVALGSRVVFLQVNNTKNGDKLVVGRLRRAAGKRTTLSLHHEAKFPKNGSVFGGGAPTDRASL